MSEVLLPDTEVFIAGPIYLSLLAKSLEGQATRRGVDQVAVPVSTIIHVQHSVACVRQAHHATLRSWHVAPLLLLAAPLP